jgi:hypothetical protein
MFKSSEIDMSSVKQILGPSLQAMIYGFRECDYTFIYNLLREKGICTFDYQAGASNFFTLEKRSIACLTFDNGDTRDTCKAALTNLFFENFKRKKSGLPLIPLIFCIQSSKVTLDLIRLAKRETDKTLSITNSELRRCYKLYKFNRTLALATFKFVRVDRSQHIYSLHEVPPFWNDPIWKKVIREREAHQNPAKIKKYYWREVLHKAMVEDATLKRGFSLGKRTHTMM